MKQLTVGQWSDGGYGYDFRTGSRVRTFNILPKVFHSAIRSCPVLKKDGNRMLIKNPGRIIELPIFYNIPRFAKEVSI